MHKDTDEEGHEQCPLNTAAAMQPQLVLIQNRNAVNEYTPRAGRGRLTVPPEMLTLEWRMETFPNATPIRHEIPHLTGNHHQSCGILWAITLQIIRLSQYLRHMFE